MRALLLLLPLLAWASPERLAVLELRNPAALSGQEASYLTDLVRIAALELPGKRFFVMTRENILAQLPPGTSLAACEGDCEVETGRNIGAHYVVSGEVVRFGAELRVSLKLHGTVDGRLVATARAEAADVKALEPALETTSRSLFAKLAPPVQSKQGFELKPIGLVTDPSQPGKFAPKLEGLGFEQVDVDALEFFDATLKFDRGDAAPLQKARRWRDVAERSPGLRAKAEARAAEWEAFEARRREAEAARRKRAAKLESDWTRLARLLRLEVVPPEDKRRWAQRFVAVYGESMRNNPHALELWPWVDDASKTAPLTNTVWTGKDSDGHKYTYRFKAGGRLEYTSPTGTYREATWRQIGPRVYMETYGRFSEYEGRIEEARTIRGTAWNRKGHQWTWGAKRRPR